MTRQERISCGLDKKATDAVGRALLIVALIFMAASAAFFLYMMFCEGHSYNHPEISIVNTSTQE